MSLGHLCGVSLGHLCGVSIGHLRGCVQATYGHLRRCVSRPLTRAMLRALNDFNDTCAGVTGERWGGGEGGREGGREGGGQKSGCTVEAPTELVVECGLGQPFAPLPSFAPLRQQGGLVTSELDYVLMRPHRQVWGCFFVAFFPLLATKMLFLGTRSECLGRKQDGGMFVVPCIVFHMY